MNENNFMSLLTFVVAFSAYQKANEYSHIEALGAVFVLVIVLLILEAVWDKLTN